MKSFSNKRKAELWRFSEYLIERYEFSDSQKRKIRDDIWERNINKFGNFEIRIPKNKTENALVRMSIIFIPIVWIAFVLWLIPNFLFTGRWGYKGNWFINWCEKLNI